MPGAIIVRYHSILQENTAEELIRKITALSNTINDKSVTDNEIKSATAIRSSLQQKLETKFPEVHRRMMQTPNPQQSTNFEDWISNIARGMDAYDQYQNDKSDPNSNKSKYKSQITTMKRQRKELAELSAMGNVVANRDVKVLTDRINRIYRDMFPEEWEKMKQAKERANSSASQRSHEKRKEKLAADSQKSLESGIPAGKSAKIYPETSKKMSELLDIGREHWRSIIIHMTQMTHTRIKEALTQLTPEESNQVREMISKTHTMGYISDSMAGITENQKSKLMALFTVSHTSPIDPESAMSFDEFKERFEHIMDKLKYRRSRFNKNQSMFDIYGQSLKAYDKREAQERIKNKLSTTDREHLVANLKNVDPVNKIQVARITKLIALLST